MGRFRFVIVGLLVVWFGVALGVDTFLQLRTAEDDDVLTLECGRRLIGSTPNRAAIAVPFNAVLVLDEEWRNHFGDRAELEARLIVTRAAGHYRSLGIHVLPVRVESWESPNEVTSLHGLLDEVESEGMLGDGDVVIVLTGQGMAGSADGSAVVGGRYAIVRHHTDNHEQDEFVLAHEIGHVFGAHHGCNVPGLAGLMAESGVEQPVRLCPCTRRAIESNVQRFHDS
ncbi:MAG: M12 family metallo-peptidase [Acidimicrobiia bacterium]